MMPEQERPDELLALRVLQQTYPQKYACAYHADKPDIWCNTPSVGVEVTWGYANNILRILGLNGNADPHAALVRYHGVHHLPFADHTGYAYEYLRANGTIATNVVPPALLGDGNDLLYAFERKVAKAPQYRAFGELNLFLHIFPTTTNNLHSFARKAASVGTAIYRFVYCYDGRRLWRIELATGAVI